MPLISASLDAFVITSLIILLPWIHIAGRASRTAAPPPYRRFLTAFVVLHTVFILYNFFLASPQNIFESLHLPPTGPSDRIAQELLNLASVTALPQHLDRLISRLSSFDGRSFYFRFGHSVVQECEHCRSFNDFALYALPRPLLEYVREVGVVGIVTISRGGQERWRQWGLGLLMGAAALEAYWLSTVEIRIAQDSSSWTNMWHDTCWRLRQALFFLVPIASHYLPGASESASPLNALPHLVKLTEQTLDRIRLLHYVRGASARSPDLRNAANAWWEQQQREGSWVREDEGVQRMAEGLGLGIGEEGPLLTMARKAIESLRNTFQPSEVA